MKCKDTVWNGTYSRSSPCPNNAKFGDYCGVHSPEEKARRRQERGPTLFERQLASSKRRERERNAKDRALKKLLGLVEEMRFLNLDQLESGFKKVADYRARVDAAVDSTRELLGMEKREPDAR